MADVPKQNWRAYSAATSDADAEWIRGLTTQDRLAIYEDAYSLISSYRDQSADWERLEHWNWHENLDLHARMRAAFLELDRKRCGLTNSANVG